jgi:hypothetical protein
VILAALALASCDAPPSRVAFSAAPAVTSARFARAGERGTVTGGIAAIDLDHDGDLDLVATQHDGELLAFRNDGALAFADWPSALPPVAASTSLALLDVEADGDLDLLVGRDGGVSLLADEGGAFRDATSDAGLAPIDGYVSGASVADVNGDGWLDVYVTRFDALDGADWPVGSPNELWLGSGGAFRPAAESPGGGATDVAPTLASSFGDLDDDGVLDLVVANDFGPFRRPLQVFRGLGADAVGEPRFADVAAAWGMDVRVFGMGLAIADLTGDARLDVYVTNAADSALFVREGDRFVERARELGAECGHMPDPDPPPLAPPVFRDFGPTGENPTPEMVDFVARWAVPARGEWTVTSWAPVAFDADDDGALDLFVANGKTGLQSILPEAAGQRGCLVRRAGARFERVSEWPDLRGASRGALAADLDGDGDLDLAWIDNGYDQDPGVRVIRNESDRGHWLALRLRGRGGNRDAIGARIAIEHGARRQIREVRTDSGFASAVPPVARFGLGADGTARTIEIRWPTGATTEIRDVPADRELTIEE